MTDKDIKVVEQEIIKQGRRQCKYLRRGIKQCRTVLNVISCDDCSDEQQLACDVEISIDCPKLIIIDRGSRRERRLHRFLNGEPERTPTILVPDRALSESISKEITEREEEASADAAAKTAERKKKAKEKLEAESAGTEKPKPQHNPSKVPPPKLKAHTLNQKKRKGASF